MGGGPRERHLRRLRSGDADWFGGGPRRGVWSAVTRSTRQGARVPAHSRVLAAMALGALSRSPADHEPVGAEVAGYCDDHAGGAAGDEDRFYVRPAGPRDATRLQQDWVRERVGELSGVRERGRESTDAVLNSAPRRAGSRAERRTCWRGSPRPRSPVGRRCRWRRPPSVASALAGDRTGPADHV